MIYYEDIQLNQTKVTGEYLIEKAEIIEFATQWDPQPFHISEEEAKKWMLGLSASGVHSLAISSKLLVECATDPVAAVAGLGHDEMRMPHPVRPGDRLHVRSYVEMKRESKSRPELGLITIVNKMFNQDDVVVLSYKSSSMIQKRPKQG